MSNRTRKRGSRKMVTTGAITSKKLARVDCIAETVYWRVYFASDNYGTMSGDPWDVLGKALPYKKGIDEGAVQCALGELVAIGLLERWDESGGSMWVHVIGHDLHQQASWLAKRGLRQSPVPPSLRSDHGEYIKEADPISEPMDAIASEGSESASQAISESSQERSWSPIATTSTTSTTEERLLVGGSGMGDTPTATQILDKARDVLASASRIDVTADSYTGSLEVFLFSKPNTKPETILTAAGRVLAKFETSKSPFSVAQAWKFMEQEIPKVQREENAPNAPRLLHGEPSNAALIAAVGAPGSAA